MNVTEHNFHDAHILLKRLLPDAAFVSIDLEFTGLGRARPSHLDTPVARYANARADAEAYPPLQCGVCIFRRTPGEKKDSSEKTQKPRWQSIPFNFNLYPRAVYVPEKARFPFQDRTLVLQASTVHFLLGHGFNFQRCFEEGVSWLRADDEKILRDHVSEQRRVRRMGRRVDISPSAEDVLAAKAVRTAVTEWLDRSPASTDKSLIAALELPRLPVQRRLVFDMLRDDFPSIVAGTISTHAGVKLRVERMASPEEAQRKRETEEAMEVGDVVDRHVGFRVIMDLLRESGVPLVVHHGLMDVTKLFANFVKPLPENIVEFKKEMREAFPCLVDTQWGLDVLCTRDRNVAILLGRETAVFAPNSQVKSQNIAPQKCEVPSAPQEATAVTIQKPNYTDASANSGTEHTEMNTADTASETQPMETDDPAIPSKVGAPSGQPVTVQNDVTAEQTNVRNGPALTQTAPISGRGNAKENVKGEPGQRKDRRRGRSKRNVPAQIREGKINCSGWAGVKELGLVKEALLDHAQRSGLDDKVAVDTFVGTDSPSVEDGPVSGFVVRDGAMEWDRNADRYAFARYCVDRSKGSFHHEAGFDALETGKLFILLQEIGADADVDVEAEMRNKIFLGTCGGFKYIDLNGGEEEYNEWFECEALVISGEVESDGPEHRFRKVLRQITEGSIYDGERSEFFTVDRTSCIGLMTRCEEDAGSTGKRRLGVGVMEEGGITTLVRNAERAGLTVVRYDRNFFSGSNANEVGDEVKKRRFL